MSQDSRDFLEQLRATFRVEAQEQLQAIAAGLLKLEPLPAPELRQPIVEAVFRAAHSLKGAARAVEEEAIEALCGSLEDSFSDWKNGRSAPTPQVLDTVHQQLDAIATRLGRSGGGAPAALQDSGPPRDGSAGPHAPRAEPRSVPRASGAHAQAMRAGDTVRVRVDTLDARLLEIEELLAVKLAGNQRVRDLRDLARQLEELRSREPAPPAAVGPAAAIGTEQARLLASSVARLTRAAEHDRDTIDRLVDDLLLASKRLMLLPFASISAPLPRLVRDLCREQGKEADLRVEGDHVEIDKRILDALTEPLMHLLRNCVAHGIEPAAQRRQSGKPVRGQIGIALARRADGKVQITVSDDGGGVDLARVKAAAVQRGLMTEQEAESLPDDEAQALMFRSGVSTAAGVSALAGRGLGLAIVQDKIHALGGELSLHSRPGAGTSFCIAVPALRSTFRGVVVTAAGRVFVLPTTQVERVVRAPADTVRRVEGRDTLLLEGRLLPLVRLADALGCAQPGGQAALGAGACIVVLGRGDRRTAFAVDDVQAESELLVKPLAPPLVRVRNIACAAVLPNAGLGLVIEVADLLTSAASAGHAAPEQGAPPAVAEPRRILVAEDSITSRILLETLLEAAGYEVSTAVDGLDALAKLRARHFDLVVSDVEMPNLNGFDLTARIRADGTLARTPVVLVTARDAPADRERGLLAGASAYIVKSSFDEDGLLETVRRLL